MLETHISSGQIRQVKGNSYAEDLISGDALAVIGWSGDITVLNFENGENWKFALPDAGGTLWSDNMMVPITSTHRRNACPPPWSISILISNAAEGFEKAPATPISWGSFAARCEPFTLAQGQY